MRKRGIFHKLVPVLLLAVLLMSLSARPILGAANRYFSCYPTTGHVGDRIEVRGQYWDATNYYILTFAFGTPYRLTQTGIIGSSGILSTDFTVPAIPGGTYTIMVESSSGGGESYSDTFRINPLVTLTKSAAIFGDQIVINGSGFAANLTATLTFDGTQFATAPLSNTGSFASITFNLPETYQGQHEIKVTDTSGNVGTANVIVNPKTTITPVSGAVGTSVAVSASGFNANANITITLAGTTVNTTPSPVTTNSKGSFQANFTVPAATGGAQEVATTDGTNRDAQTFTVVAGLIVEPTTGFSGTEVTVTGTGFLPNISVSVIFDNDLMKTAYTNSYGQFGTRFPVPARNAGTYMIQATDGTNNLQANFTITTTASISPETTAAAPGHVGTPLTVTGIGFQAGKTLTVTYDNTQAATAPVGTDGTFTVTFNAPESAAGNHIIAVSDGTSTKQFNFAMETLPPSTPAPLKPEIDSREKAETTFEWQSVTDPSGVTYTLQIATKENFAEGSVIFEKTELTQPEYTLTKDEALESTSKKEPYYWRVRAVDGAGNASPWTGAGAFYVGGFSLFSFSFSPVVLIILIVVGVVLVLFLGIWLGRRTAYF
ncbi:MAG: hypothetical protein ABIH70_07845 [Chloroflexota bacterium]